MISDTHIPDRAKEIPAQILDDFRNSDLVLHAGDLVCLEVLDVLKDACKEVKAVWGNMDSLQVRRGLPERQIIPIQNLRLGLIHGEGPPFKLINMVNNAFKNEKVNIIIFGHSHYPINEKRQDILYFNPGSPTDKVFSPFNSYGILEITNGQISTEIKRI